MFLRDLRRLRGRRRLSLDELAARSGFPADELAATETGPGLPSLPALEAYVRGCGAPLAAWEDRWRQLTQEGPAAAGPAAAGTLPTRDPGTSPLALAGAMVAPASPAQPASDGKRPGPPGAAPRRRAFSRRYALAALGAAVLLIAGGGIALRSLSGTGGHHVAVGPRAPAPGGAATGRAAPRPRPGHRASGRSGGQLDVAGVGCPENGNVAVALADAPTGPGWMAAGGGWTGNGCDGSAVWTLNPNGNQPVSSALTWTLVPASGTSRCTLSVFVPAQNALGGSEYDIFSGSQSPRMSQLIATIRVWQGATSGQWVTLGSYPVSGTFEIRLMPDMSPSVGPGPGAHGRHHVAQAPGAYAAIAASAASAACT